MKTPFFSFFPFSVFLVGLLGFGDVAFCATLSGTLQNVEGAGIEGLQARMWRDDDGKGFKIVAETLSLADGSFNFAALEAGIYRLDARMPPLFEGNYADRWYDVEEPVSEGWIGESADLIVLEAEDSVSGYDLQLPIYGGLDGRIIVGTDPVTGFQIRMERALDPRIHHNDTSDPDPASGEFSMRGMPPSDDYQILVHDPNAVWGDLVSLGPYSINPDEIISIGDLLMPVFMVDPYEPNNDPTADGANSVDTSLFSLGVPEPWIAETAFIGPRNGDIDWYCFSGNVGERYHATIVSGFSVNELQRENPWFDPILSFWSVDETTQTLLHSNDDGIEGTLRPFIDTTPVEKDGQYCFAVSAFGDTAWNGTTQQSAGSYGIVVSPEIITIDENTTLLLDITVSDEDGEPVDVRVEHRNAFNEIIDGRLAMGPLSGNYSWFADSISAEDSPYEITFRAVDSVTFTQQKVLVVVNSLNEAPSTPIQISPERESVIENTFPTLVVENAQDPDGDSLRYTFELYENSTENDPIQTGTIPERIGPETTFVCSSSPEDTPLFWRVRATDNQVENAFSPWSDFWDFTVSLIDDPPIKTTLIKPFQNEELLSRTVTLSVENTADPELEDVFFHFEISLDNEFTDLVERSDLIAQNEVDETTSWTATTILDRGGRYFARAIPEDSSGTISDPSNIRFFTVRENTSPSMPNFDGPLSQCGGVIIEEEMPTEFVVLPVLDGEDTSLHLELELFVFDEETAIFTTTQEQASEGNTSISLEEVNFEENEHYLVRIRSYDEQLYSEWTECDFWVDLSDDLLSAVVISYPEDGTSVPAPEVFAQIEAVIDPEEGLPGNSYEFAYCISFSGPDDCSNSYTQWPRISPSEEGSSSLLIDNLFFMQEVYLEVCAIDENEVCGPSDSVQFNVLAERITSEGGCGCETTPQKNKYSLFLLLFGLTFYRRLKQR